MMMMISFLSELFHFLISSIHSFEKNVTVTRNIMKRGGRDVTYTPLASSAVACLLVHKNRVHPLYLRVLGVSEKPVSQSPSGCNGHGRELHSPCNIPDSIHAFHIRVLSKQTTFNAYQERSNLMFVYNFRREDQTHGGMGSLLPKNSIYSCTNQLTTYVDIFLQQTTKSQH